MPDVSSGERIASLELAEVRPTQDTTARSERLLRHLKAVLPVALPAAIFAWLCIDIGAVLTRSVDGDLTKLDAFAHLLVLDTPLAAASLAIVLLSAVFAPAVPRAHLRAFVAWLARHPLLVAAATLPLLALASVTVYQGQALSADEYAPLFQAKAFARGSLTGQMDPAILPRAFGPGVLGTFFSGSADTGDVISSYWPGHALLLAPFAAMAVPWLLNPLITAGTLVLVHRLTTRLSRDPRAPGWAMLFCLASPAFVVNGISFYSMPAHLLISVAFVLLMLEPSPNRVVAAGVVGSIGLTLHNPFPHVLFAIPWILWLWHRHGFSRVVRLMVGYLPLTVLLGCGWLWLRSRLRETALAPDPLVYWAGDNLAEKLQSFFGIYFVPGVSALLARVAEFVKIWVWAVPVLPALAVIGWWRGRSSVAVRLICASVLTTMTGYVFFSLSQGHGWGSRYFHSAWLALPLLATIAVVSRDTALHESREQFAGALAVLSLVFVNAVALSQVAGFIQRHVSQVPGSDVEIEAAVILLHPDSGYYISDLIQNDPMLLERPIRLMSFGEEEDLRFMGEHFPGMRVVRATPHGTVWSASPSARHRPAHEP